MFLSAPSGRIDPFSASLGSQVSLQCPDDLGCRFRNPSASKGCVDRGCALTTLQIGVQDLVWASQNFGQFCLEKQAEPAKRFGEGKAEGEGEQNLNLTHTQGCG